MIRNTITEAINDSNTVLKAARYKKVLDVSKNSSRSPSKSNAAGIANNGLFVKTKKKNEVTVEADNLIQKMSTFAPALLRTQAHNIKADDYQIDLDGVKIIQKREAFYQHGKLEIRPAAFEIDIPVVPSEKRTEEEIDTGGLDILDNKIPRKLQELIEKKALKQALKKNQTAEVATMLETQKSFVEDPNDIEPSKKLYQTVTGQLIKQTQMLSLEGVHKCNCQCHSAEKQVQFCKICLCIVKNGDNKSEQEMITIDHNLLADVPLSMYKNQEKRRTGDVTEATLREAAQQHIDTLSPQERLYVVADQASFLAQKMWSPLLRADVSPGVDLNRLERQLAQRTRLVSDVDQKGLEDVDQKNTRKIASLMIRKNPEPAVIDKDREEERLRLKYERDPDEKTLINLRRRDLSGPERLIHESLVKTKAHPPRYLTDKKPEPPPKNPRALEITQDGNEEIGPDIQQLTDTIQHISSPARAKYQPDMTIKPRVNAPSRLEEIPQRLQPPQINKELSSAKTRFRLQQLIQETNASPQEMAEMTEKARERLAELDARTNQAILTKFEPIDFRTLHRYGMK